ncbi:phosphatase PAP2 family protein [Sphingomonas sp. H160509]|uniref:phosphatase PAP2 family protein n=1 Tax=Sphingomonas sp. H160509 TaxID=2955313 RepID=UPI00406D07B7
MNDVSIATNPRLPADIHRGALPAHDSVPDYGWWIGGGMILSLAMLTVMMHVAGLSIDPYDADNMPFYVSGVVLLALRFGLRDRPWRHARAVADCAEYYGVFTLLALMGAVASYPVAALTHGFHDAALQRIDALLHFDWLAWYRLVAETPVLQTLGLAAYRSIYLTPAILFATFAYTGDRVAAHRFLATFWLTAIGTLIPLRLHAGDRSVLVSVASTNRLYARERTMAAWADTCTPRSQRAGGRPWPSARHRISAKLPRRRRDALHQRRVAPAAAALAGACPEHGYAAVDARRGYALSDRHPAWHDRRAGGDRDTASPHATQHRVSSQRQRRCRDPPAPLVHTP